MAWVGSPTELPAWLPTTLAGAAQGSPAAALVADASDAAPPDVDSRASDGQALPAQASPGQPNPAQANPARSDSAQDNSVQSELAPPRDESQLTDGLLELLEKQPSSPRPSGQPEGQAERSPVQPPADAAAPASEGRSASSHPLRQARQDMQVTAGYLRQGRADEATLALQGSIVARLDELIAALEQARSDSQPSAATGDAEADASGQPPLADDGSIEPSPNGTSATDPSQTDADQAESGQTESDLTDPRLPESAEPGDEEAASGDGRAEPSADGEQGQPAVDEAGDQPGYRGPPARGQVQRNDPTALQQSVWGHLPPQVRSRMQSRMVEQFLPSYREQLEAYYRALLEQEPEEEAARGTRR